MFRYYEQEGPPSTETVERSVCIGRSIQELIDSCLYASIVVFGPFPSLRNILRTLNGRTKGFLEDALFRMVSVAVITRALYSHETDLYLLDFSQQAISRRDTLAARHDRL